MTGGRKSELTAKTDDYSTVGEIGVKRTSPVGNLVNDSLAFVRLIKSADYAYDW